MSLDTETLEELEQSKLEQAEFREVEQWTALRHKNTPQRASRRLSLRTV